MGIDVYGFVEGFDEAKGEWKNISPLTDRSQLGYDGFGYPEEVQYLFSEPLPEKLDVVRSTELHKLLQDTRGKKVKGVSWISINKAKEQATSLTRDIFYYLDDLGSLFVVDLQALKDYQETLENTSTLKENLETMITQIEKIGSGYQKIRFVYVFD